MPSTQRDATARPIAEQHVGPWTVAIPIAQVTVVNTNKLELRVKDVGAAALLPGHVPDKMPVLAINAQEGHLVQEVIPTLKGVARFPPETNIDFTEILVWEVIKHLAPPA